MICCNVMSNDVAQRPPYELDVFLCQIIAGPLDRAPILQLKCDMMQCLLLIINEIQRMVINATAQERKTISDPVGHTESHDIAIKLGQLLRIVHTIGNMPKLNR